MDDETDNATVDIAKLLESPKPASQQPSQPTGQDQTLEEILAQSSTDLIHSFAASISQGAVKEASKTEEFRQEFKRRLLRSIMRTYVWSTARLAHETESSEGRLARGVQDLLSAEREQGRSSPPTVTTFGSSVSISVVRWTIVAADLARADRLRGRLSELMAAVGRAVEMFAQF